MTQMEDRCMEDNVNYEVDSLVDIPHEQVREDNPETASARLDEHIGWDRKIEYLFASCGFVTSFDSFVRFPYLSAKYGGGKTIESKIHIFLGGGEVFYEICIRQP